MRIGNRTKRLNLPVKSFDVRNPVFVIHVNLLPVDKNFPFWTQSIWDLPLWVKERIATTSVAMGSGRIGIEGFFSVRMLHTRAFSCLKQMHLEGPL